MGVPFNLEYWDSGTIYWGLPAHNSQLQSLPVPSNIFQGRLAIYSVQAIHFEKVDLKYYFQLVLVFSRDVPC